MFSREEIKDKGLTLAEIGGNYLLDKPSFVPVEFYDLNFKLIKDQYNILLYFGLDTYRKFFPYQLASVEPGGSKKESPLLTLSLMEKQKMNVAIMEYNDFQNIGVVLLDNTNYMNFVDEITSEDIKMSRIKLRMLLFSIDTGEEFLKKLQKENNVNLAVNFHGLCSYVVKDNDVYYRDIGYDYYYRVKNEYKKSRFSSETKAILQVLDSITGEISYSENSFLFVLKKESFQRWINKNIDGYFGVIKAPEPGNSLLNEANGIFPIYIHHGLEENI